MVPYHVVFDQNCSVLQCGAAIAKYYSLALLCLLG